MSANFATYPSLAGARVFITGGATGIGAALVEAFAQQGARVAFVDRDAAAGAALADQLGEATEFAELDVTDLHALASAVDAFADRQDGLDVLVNNVANDTRHAALDVTPESWRAALAVNLDAAFFAAQAAARRMRAAGRGSIVSLGSINALLGPANMPAYVAAKSALIGLTKALAREFGPDGVRVNALLPGWVVTERQLALWLTPEAEADWMKQVSLQRRITPRDVANYALFLAADDSALVTGQSVVIDGGRT